MKYVIIRDDDTNALTPTQCLETLYRPFLERGMPVGLAVIPNVSATAAYHPGKPEKFLPEGPLEDGTVPICSSPELIDYLRKNALFRIAQHGCRHDTVHECREFDHNDRSEIVARLEQGKRYLIEAGLGCPCAFVAPYDRISKTSYVELARRFKVISTGWFEWDRIPLTWLSKYALKKGMRRPHWRAGNAILLSHPGCLLSYHRSYSLILQEIERAINAQRLTVLVTHWWEYFLNGKANEEFIGVLHQAADYLASRGDVRVISFEDVATGKVPLK